MSTVCNVITFLKVAQFRINKQSCYFNLLIYYGFNKEQCFTVLHYIESISDAFVRPFSKHK